MGRQNQNLNNCKGTTVLIFVSWSVYLPEYIVVFGPPVLIAEFCVQGGH